MSLVVVGSVLVGVVAALIGLVVVLTKAERADAVMADAVAVATTAGSTTVVATATAPCDPALVALDESARTLILGTTQCAVVYMDKYASVYIRVGAQYLGLGPGTGPANGLAARGVGSAVRLGARESAVAFRFVRASTTDRTKYRLLLVRGGAVAVDANTGAFYVKGASDATSTLTVTGVPKQFAIAVHGARVEEGGLVRAAAGRAAAPAVVAHLLDMKGAPVYGMYVPKATADLLDESIAHGSKLRAMKASCCSRFRSQCVDEADTVLKPMCCTECADTLETCAQLVRYDAGPMIQRDMCCLSIAQLGVRRVYGDAECADAPGACARDAAIEHSKLASLNDTLVPSFGEIAIGRFLCNELYT